MDIFVYKNPNEPTLMEQGEILNNIDSKMWIERYRDAGEFTLIAPISSQIRVKCPIGSFISHTNTREIMVVENHEINDDSTSEAIVTVTGRSLETVLENRIAGSNKTFPVSGQVVDLTLAANYTQQQAVTLINTYVGTAALIDDDDAIPHIIALTDMPNQGSNEARTFKRDTVYKLLKDLLVIDNLGIKVMRYGVGSTYDRTWTQLVIHQGKSIDSSKAVFSIAEGGIETADYLYSNKNVKNAALVTSKWFELTVKNWNGTYNGYARRMLYIDASDLDQQYTTQPTGSLATSIQQMLTIRGQSAIQAHNAKTVLNPKALDKAHIPVFRRDYDVGDVLFVGPNMMRVSEYVEIEDDKGDAGYPTFTDPGDLNV